MNNTNLTVIGGGLAGLTAAIAAAESGAPVRLYEAHTTVGGRGRATPAPYVAHEGAHVFYADGPHYAWLKKRGFVSGLGWPGARDAVRLLQFRVDGRIRPLPPLRMLGAQTRRWLKAPVDQDFHSWASDHWGEVSASRMANAISVVTYDANTGGLSAAFVWELFQRVLGPNVPAIRWVRGGWQTVIDRMAARARELGVVIETGSRVSDLPSDGPVIVATELAAARTLLRDDTLCWRSGHAALLDIAVTPRRGDRNLVFDLDEGGFHESYSMQDASTAPAGEALYQLQMPVRDTESHADAHRRLAGLADVALPDWRSRTTFERTAVAQGRTGALDLPGETWRDRPAIDRGDGVYLVGDMVAAPGMRGEISINSAVQAAAAAVHALESVKTVRHNGSRT
ncbi:FAD-dependent oxidoreductase [Mycolicibacterium sp. (ex Dasyatis americana)]|uniref:FAD-dependent oxidoreductase n=1 Tax=Mycobacterium syngnathidarum TaxID=1908205 RepID=A0A1S1JDP8_9MYCO|nr:MULTISPECIES: NAD(P)-binding protein [Mycobacterium]MCG7608325.1 NAD(P)-binding protein [Mycobacterium sp. CnD-18-1]OFB41961.1 FAD-dependent oxidoreductase [Mycolicibacterium sp. (ex Dasyatis americana)]OHT81275.1 FAD-dependent oxidoreductase [Mycobacterium syngnathidarum]TMS45978.1 FAD-dependent oxidoreductase [Mycobacterium sp. DBP42]